MADYYKQRLSAERLRRCYEIATPRVKQYLEAEIAFLLEHLRPGDRVLELGCGYGRVLKRLMEKAEGVVGIDTSYASLLLAREEVGPIPSCGLIAMNAADLGLHDHAFDLVACIQNGISAFRTDQRRLIQGAVRVTRPGGKVLFSSYSHRFWNDRLEWFQRQAEEGLIGEIDRGATGNGVIVCKDGFRATTLGAEDFRSICSGLGIAPEITEVDGSSLFCEIRIPGAESPSHAPLG